MQTTKKEGFTLIELLVVIAIIALLLSIIMPALKKAKNQAKKLMCAANLHQIQIGCTAYANNNDDHFPTRGPDFAGLPHQMVSSDGRFPLQETFITPYLSGIRNDIMFCPGELIRYRDPDNEENDYATYYVTYQYHNYPQDCSLWIVDQPRLDKCSAAKPTASLWGCLTVSTIDDEEPYLSHNVNYQPNIPCGMNSVRVDGSTQWQQWDDIQAYYQTPLQSYYWAKPR